ncbi:MAG: glycoside hydrolase family 15 protein [Bacillota bacterium]
MLNRGKAQEPLVDISIDVIKRNQHPSGAYVASPCFPNYAYCWLRDGTYTANAMDRFGEHESARAYFLWVNRTIAANRSRLERAVRAGSSVQRSELANALPARWTLDGGRDETDWPSFQLDGYGTWLWGLAEHVVRTGDAVLLEELHEGIRLTLEYLRLAWRLPNYSCWEEHGDQVHTSTLACLAGGIGRIARLIGDPSAEALAAEIRGYLLECGIVDGRLSKFCRQQGPGPQIIAPGGGVRAGRDIGDSVDASLLWVTVPFGLLGPFDPRMLRTVEEVERTLVRDYGVHRYPADTYYGGGLWLLLSAWLGWYYCEAGRLAEARSCLAWVEAQADADGLMPEQVDTHLIDPGYRQPWIERWGPVAKPLLWSHAMYLILRSELDRH